MTARELTLNAVMTAVVFLATFVPVPTILIKALEAEIFWRLREKFLLGLIAASLAMTAGYTLAGAFLYDSLAAGLASTPGLLLKSAVNISAVVVLSAALKNKIVR